MVPATTGTVVQNPLPELFRVLFSRSFLIWLGISLLFILIPAHLLWILDRGNADGVSPNKSYFPGIFDSMMWAFSALTSQVPSMPRQWLARVLGLIWMFAGVVFVAAYTAQLTTTLTVEQIRGAINGPDDLPGKRIATLKATTSADYLREHNIEAQEFPDTDTMFQALRDGKVDAVLFSAPTLRYYAAHAGKGNVRMVGPEFRKADLGLVLPLDSTLRRRINAALLALRDDGTYEKIYGKWFGNE